MQIQNLCFSYGKKAVLTDLTLTLTPGKLICILGNNGSGKTTLLHLMARQLSPKSGSMICGGKEISHYSRKEYAKLVTLLPQNPLIPALSVYDLVSCGRYPYLDLSRRLQPADRKAILDALQATDTLSFADKSLCTLSGGECRSAFLAMAYAQDTPYLLLDEPTTHLDAAHSISLMQRLSALAQSGKCVVAVLHDIPLALQYANTLILLKEGRCLFSGSVSDAIETDMLYTALEVHCHAVSAGGDTAYYLTK